MARIGPYSLGSLAGTGGSGVVYEALHEARGDRVALKILTRGRLADDVRQAAFDREVRASAALDHPRVVAIRDFGRLAEPLAIRDVEAPAGTPWLATEWLGGGTLASARPPETWSELRGVLVALLDALAHAHAHDLVHRDLKPANALLGQASSLDSVKLADLGIALRTDERVAETTLSGTPSYMAPEQILQGLVGAWTDLYALGILGWELASGERPFRGANAHRVMTAHLRDPPPPFQARCPVPDDFETWLRVLMSKRAEDRYACAADARAVLLGLGEASGRAANRPALADPGASPTFAFDVSHAPSPEVEARLLGRPRPAPAALPPHWGSLEPASDPEISDISPVLLGLRSPPMFGRVDQQRALWAHLRQVEADERPRQVLLHGSSGCGLTTLSEWARVLAREHGWYGWRVDLSDGTDPAAGVVASRLGVAHLRGAELGDALRSRLGSIDPDEALWLTALLDPERGRSLGAELESDGQRRHVAARVIEAAARARPTVVTLDGVHRSPEAIRLARALAEIDAPLLVLLCAADDQEADPAMAAALGELPELVDLEVPELDPQSARFLLRYGLGFDATDAPRVADLAGGNPQLLMHLVDQALATGQLRVASSGVSLRSDSALTVPDDLDAATADRLARLIDGRPGIDLQSLVLAAVLGRQVDFEEWRSACGFLGIEPDFGWVHALVRARLALLRPGGFRFSPVRVRDQLLARVPDLTELHLACARALESRPGTERRRGQHLARAGEWEAALEPLLEASFTSRSDTAETAAAALALAEEAVERLQLTADDVRWARVLYRRARVDLSQNQLDAAEAAMREVLAGPDDPEFATVRAWCRIGIAQIARKRGDSHHALELLEAAIDDLDPTLAAHRSPWFYLHRNIASLLIDLHLLDRADAVLAGDRHDELGADLDRGFNAYTRGRVAIERGDLDAAEALLNRAVELLQRGVSRGPAEAENLLGDVARKRGDLDRAERHYVAALRSFRMIGNSDVAVTHANLAMVRLAAGRFAPAERDLLRAEALFRSAGWVPMVAAMQVGQGVCAAAAGDWERFDQCFASARPVIERTGFAPSDLVALIEQAASEADRAGQDERARGLTAWVQELRAAATRPV